MQTQRIRKEGNDAHFPSPFSYSSDIFVMLLSALLSFEMKQSVFKYSFLKANSLQHFILVHLFHVR